MNFKAIISLIVFYCPAASAVDLEALHEPCKLDGGKTKTVTDGSFISTALDHKLIWTNVRSKYHSVSVEMVDVKNPHWQGATNKIALLRAPGNYFSFYIMTDKQIPICISVESGDLSLDGGIKIGSNIEKVSKLFNIQDNFDILTIKSLEGGNAIKIHFNNKSVDRIIYETFYLD